MPTETITITNPVAVEMLTAALNQVTEQWRTDPGADPTDREGGTWNQDDWVDCLAGFLARVAGWHTTAADNFVAVKDGESEYIGGVAAEVLGLARWSDEFIDLTSHRNSIADLWNQASELTGGAIPVPDEFEV